MLAKPVNQPSEKHAKHRRVAAKFAAIGRSNFGIKARRTTMRGNMDEHLKEIRESAERVSETYTEPAPVKNNTPPQPKTHNEDMSTATTELMDARLELIETRMDARVSRIEADLSGLRADTQAARTELRDDMNTLRADMGREMGELRAEIKSMKWWLLGTGIAVVLGVAAFNATVLSNMVASFESGKNTAQALGQTEAALKEREQRLERIEAKLDALANQRTAKP